MQLSRTVLRVVPIAIAVGLFAACGTAAKLVGQGGECEQATDCEDGLVCVPEKDGSHKCDSDLSGIQAPPEVPDAAGKDATAADASTDGSSGTDATQPDDVSAPPPDTSPPPADVTAPPPDTSVPPVDAAQPDTSAPPPDAAAD